MENDTTLPALFKDGIIIIYAVVIGISFDLSKDILVPIYSISENLVNAFILFLGYFIVLSSWREYFSSMKKYPHKGNLGFGRFILDLLILFVFYYIIIIGSQYYDTYLIPDIFVYVMPVLFFLFTLWDFFRLKEYPSDKILHHERNISRYFLLFFLVISLSYIGVSYVTNFESFGQISYYRDLIFSILSISVVVIFRITKGLYMREPMVKK